MISLLFSDMLGDGRTKSVLSLLIGKMDKCQFREYGLTHSTEHTCIYTYRYIKQTHTEKCMRRKPKKKY